MKRWKAAAAIATLAVASLGLFTVARGGHEIPVYPSYYPHEISISEVTPERAAELLPAGKIQAYIGAEPRFAGAPADSIGSVETLGSFVVVRVNPASPKMQDPQSACAAIDRTIRDLAGRSPDFIVHPYPVTPFHGDYLHHGDLAQAERARLLGGSAGPPDPAPPIARHEESATDSAWDVEIVRVDVAELIAPAARAMNGWLGPPWLKQGWFQAQLLVVELAGAEAAAPFEAAVQRLEASATETAAERINLERSLVAAIAASCRLRVAGYTVERVYFSTLFNAGIENIGYDSMMGFNSAIFVRTVKLRDFPWNGWLALGIDAAPDAAWNPIAGFTGDFGRLLWSAVGDPAAIPSPYGPGWIFNRIADLQWSAEP